MDEQRSLPELPASEEREGKVQTHSLSGSRNPLCHLGLLSHLTFRDAGQKSLSPISETLNLHLGLGLHG